jgi:hypothetical protein
MTTQHTSGEWRYTCRGKIGEWAVYARKGSETVVIAHLGLDTAGDNTYGGEREANVRMLKEAKAAPHECDDPQCPGNVNRLKLEAFDELKVACKFLLEQCSHYNFINGEHEGDYIRAYNALAKAEKLG